MEGLIIAGAIAVAVILIVFAIAKSISSASGGGYVRMDVMTVDEDNDVPENTWYRKAHWESQEFLRFKGAWNKDVWVFAGRNTEVKGMHIGGRANKLKRALAAGCHKIELQREPDNKHDPNAIKVFIYHKQWQNIGYVERETAKKLAIQKHLMAIPHTVNFYTTIPYFSITVFKHRKRRS